MDTINCPACGKEIPADATRCTFCGQIQGFSSRKLGEGLKPRESSDANLPVESPVDNLPPTPPKETEEPVNVPQPAVSTGGRLSRLKTILTGKPAEADMDSLRREGLLPDDGSVEGIQKPGLEKSSQARIPPDEFPAAGLPEWLRATEFNPDNEAIRMEESNSQAEMAASMGELPEWVRKLQDKIENREDIPPISEPAGDQSVQATTTGATQGARVKDEKAIPVIDIQEPDASLIESVTAYLGGLKIPRKMPPDANRRLSRRVWGVIGLAMFGLAVAFLRSGSSVTALSQPADANLADMTSYIDTMSPESTVLVGMDYDVSLAGEIDNVALPVIVHLMSKQVSLVFVSTRPTGPALSNHLIRLGANWLPDYSNEKTFVCSYLPGGAAGLLQLVASPRQALPLKVDGTNPWLSQELASIQDISDFTLVLLLADSSGSGRDWLEQVQPRLEDTPLFAIVSIQAEPIFTPYKESGQIQAMVAGISDGASYERVHLLTTTNQQMLSAYHGMLLFMAILLACIILISIFPQNLKINSPKRSRKHVTR